MSYIMAPRTGNTGLLGSRLKRVREDQKITQEDFAERMGVAYQQVWRWETGKNDPSGDMLARMARILSVSVDFLLGLVDDPAGSFSEEGLTPVERRLITELRAGKLRDVFQTLASLSDLEDASGGAAAPDQD